MHIKIDFFIPISPIILVLGITVLVNLVLAYRVWIGNRRNPVNIYYALTVLMIAFWTTSKAGFYLADTPLLIGMFARLMFVWAALIAFFFYLFTYHFPFRINQLSRSYYFVLICSTIFVLVISVLPDFFLASRVALENRYNPEISLLWHVVYALYFTVWILLAYRNLYLKYKNSDGIWRKRLRQIIIATGVAAVIGSLFTLYIPIFYNESLGWIGHLATVFMAVYIWYYIFWKTSHNKKYDS